ncbi:MAG: cytidylate kinase-like family protein [Dehalococcoidia bacterium]
MPVITVSGKLGSGAREIAQAVAATLELDYVDQEIMVEAARELGVSISDIASRDERPSSMGERLAGIMRTLMERSAAAGAPDPMSGGGLEMVLARTYGEAAELPEAGQGQFTDDNYLRTLTSVIRGVASRGNVVILGRGSQAILRDEPEALHVYVIAPKSARIASFVEREGMTPGDAEKRIKQSDHNREMFHRRYFKVEAGDPALYDLVINAGRIATPIAARLIAAAVHEREPRPG